MLPAIVARPPNWNGYTHYGVNTKRGLKQAAKQDWAK
jgi:NADH:ubiquinone oxidoreductase subunit